MEKVDFKKSRNNHVSLIDCLSINESHISVCGKNPFIANYYTIILIEEGAVEVVTNNNSFLIEKNTLFFNSCWDIIRYNLISAKLKGKVLVFDIHSLNQFYVDNFFLQKLNIFKLFHKNNTLPISNPRELIKKYNKIEEEVLKNESDSPTLIVGLLFIFLIEVNRKYSDYYALEMNLNKFPPSLETLLSMLKESPTIEKNVAYYALKLKISQTKLRTLTQKYLNITPSRLLKKNLFQHIEQDMRKGVFSLKEISYKYGFSELSNFNRFFKNIKKMPPSHFIKNKDN